MPGGWEKKTQYPAYLEVEGSMKGCLVVSVTSVRRWAGTNVLVRLLVLVSCSKIQDSGTKLLSPCLSF